jgi:outer membrane immunogenic protein
MIKKLLLSSCAVVAITGSALAADLPSRKAPPVAYAPAPVFTWTGFYVGANGGAGWTRNQSLPYVETFGGTYFYANDFGPLRSRTGAFGGGQAGFNWQTGMFVFGLETDAQASSIRSNAFVTNAPYLTLGNSITINSAQRVDYFGTIRGRVGIGWDRVLVYGTGGFAYAGVRNSFGMSDTFGFNAYNNNAGDTARTGYAVGGGIEWMFAPNWSIKAEYQYIGLRRGPNTAATEFTGPVGLAAGGLGTAFVINGTAPSIGLHTARVGVNYHFGWAGEAAPVVARY